MKFTQISRCHHNDENGSEGLRVREVYNKGSKGRMPSYEGLFTWGCEERNLSHVFNNVFMATAASYMCEPEFAGGVLFRVFVYSCIRYVTFCVCIFVY